MKAKFNHQPFVHLDMNVHCPGNFTVVSAAKILQHTSSRIDEFRHSTIDCTL